MKLIRVISISAGFRMMVAAGAIVFVASLGIIAFVVDQEVRSHSTEFIQEQLHSLVDDLIAAINAGEYKDSGDFWKKIFPDYVSESRLSPRNSGYYAEISKEDKEGGEEVVWQSSESYDDMEFPQTGDMGIPVFAERKYKNKEYFVISFPVTLEKRIYETKTDWTKTDDNDPGGGNLHAFRVAISHDSHSEKYRSFNEWITSFRLRLWGTFVVIALVLLGVQGALVAWSLKPLRRAAEELREIESGDRPELSGSYPPEIAFLIDNINSLIRTVRAQNKRYSERTENFAHGMKTPLAVLRCAADGDARSTPEEQLESLRQTLHKQVDRMAKQCDYELKSATISRRGLAERIDVVASLQKLRTWLLGAYPDGDSDIVIASEASVWAQVDERDFMEILGNVMENGCKYGNGRIEVKVWADGGWLDAEVEDNGAGMAREDIENALTRGGRGDNRQPGHGLGLAIVNDLVTDVYRGKLDIGRSGLGGTRVRIRLDCRPIIRAMP